MKEHVPPAMESEPAGSALRDLPLGDFVTRWWRLTGGPPAVMLDDRSAMVALLVESVPVAAATLASPRRPGSRE